MHRRPLRFKSTHRLSSRRRAALAKLLVLTAGSWILLSACGAKPAPKTIKLPPTPILSLQQSWGVVNAPQLRLRQGPTISSEALITLWKGYVLEIVRRSLQTETIGDNTDYWYYINYKGLRGWVYGQYIIMYDSRQRAEEAAKELLK